MFSYTRKKKKKSIDQSILWNKKRTKKSISRHLKKNNYMLQQKTKKNRKHKYPHIKNEWAKKSLKAHCRATERERAATFMSILQKYVSYSIFIFSVSFYRVYSYSFCRLFSHSHHRVTSAWSKTFGEKKIMHLLIHLLGYKKRECSRRPPLPPQKKQTNEQNPPKQTNNRPQTPLFQVISSFLFLH